MTEVSNQYLIFFIDMGHFVSEKKCFITFNKLCLKKTVFTKSLILKIFKIKIAWLVFKLEKCYAHFLNPKLYAQVSIGFIYFRSSPAGLNYPEELSSESIYGTIRISDARRAAAIISCPFGNYSK